MMKRRLPVTAEEWLSHAESDLNLAKLGQADKNILHEQICFHAQQTAEKAIKSVLLFQKIDFPLTHDLEELIDILETTEISLPGFINEIGMLTPYAVETRYPGFWGEITEGDVDEALSLAEKVLNWTKIQLKLT